MSIQVQYEPMKGFGIVISSIIQTVSIRYEMTNQYNR